MDSSRIAAIVATVPDIVETITHHAALAFFGCAYADQADDADQPMQGEIMDQLPAVIDSAALSAAETLLIQATAANGYAGQLAGCIFCLYGKAQALQETAPDDTGDRELNPEMFGHYLAMHAMGTGVGLESFGVAIRDGITVPYVEFGGHSLECDYFTTAGDV